MPNSGLEATQRVARLLDVYRAMRLARWIDETELEMVRRGDAFFQVPGTGHEGVAILSCHLRQQDRLHLHYRDKALLLARGASPEVFFDTLLCNSASPSRGRQMIHHLSLVGPVGNSALQAVGVASAIRRDPARPIVVCAVGDGTTQQGEFLEAIGEAVRSGLPVLFLVEDNGLAISSRTAGKTFYCLPTGYPPPREFFGLPLHRLDGRDPAECDESLAQSYCACVKSAAQPWWCSAWNALRTTRTSTISVPIVTMRNCAWPGKQAIPFATWPVICAAAASANTSCKPSTNRPRPRCARPFCDRGKKTRRRPRRKRGPRLRQRRAKASRSTAATRELLG